MKKILFAASEGVPFIKTGGLADVVGSLPKCTATGRSYENDKFFIFDFQVEIGNCTDASGINENTEISPYCDTDAGLAIGNMTLAAWNHGVGSCVIAACNKTELSKMFALAENCKLHSVIAFGYPTHTSRIDPVRLNDVPFS